MRARQAALGLVDMHRSAASSAAAALQWSLYALAVVLAGVVVARALTGEGTGGWVAAALAVTWALIYLVGARMVSGRRAGYGWLAALTVAWLACLCLSPEAVYLVFVLFFLYLHLLGARRGAIAVAAATAVAIVGFAGHNGWTVAAFVGPILGAGVAVVISAGYRGLYAELVERQRLIDELMATRENLAAEQRAVGKARERERLSREIHDTVAQSLSSIQMLLFAAERSVAEQTGITPPAELSIARDAAAEALTETRGLIAELSPAPLAGGSLVSAIGRIADRARGHGIRTDVVVDGDPQQLPMALESVLVRIAQGAVSNVVRHARANTMRVTITYASDDMHLDIVDDGTGFDTEATRGFGLATIERRAAELGGRVDITSEPGNTSVAVAFPTEPAAESAGAATDDTHPTGTESIT